jgi:tetratricopeptide (TPR) repeat protein
MQRLGSFGRASRIIGLLLVGAAVTSGLNGQESESRLDAFRQAIVDAEKSLQVGELQTAESRYRTALFEGWVLLGSLAEGSGDLLEARSAYEQAIASAVEVRPARMALAGILAQIEDFDEAEALLRLLIAQDKNDFEARRLLSDTLADAGRAEESIQELEQLVSMNPEDLETTYYLSTAYLAERRTEEADFLLERLAEAIPTPQMHILIGRAYRDHNYFERARKAFDTAIELDPKVQRARFYRGTVDLRDQGQAALEAAREWFEEELQVNPDDPMTNLYLGMALVDGRRYAEAIPHLETASRSATIRADALQFLGKSLLGEDRLAEAIAAFRRGLETLQAEVGNGPDVTLTELEARQISQFHYQLAQTLRKTGDHETAAVHFDAAKDYQVRQKESAEEVLDRYLATGSGEDDVGAELRGQEPPGQPSVEMPTTSGLRDSIETALAGSYLNLGVLKAKANEPGLAASLFQQAADLDPELAQVQYSLGIARFNAGLFQQAVGPLSRALEERRGDEQLEQMLALAWFNADEYEKAAEILADLPARHSTPGLQYAFGVALVRSGRPAEAEGVFRELLARNVDWPELNVVLAQAHASQGDFDTAVELLERALVLNPQVAEAHATLGEIHMRKGELEEAEEELRRELSAHPEDTRTMYTLATVLDMAQKPTEAMTQLRSLLDLEPRLGKGRYLLGKLLLAQGSLEGALEQLEAAAGLTPDDASVHYQLGQAYQKLGRREEARREFDTFRQLKNEKR